MIIMTRNKTILMINNEKNGKINNKLSPHKIIFILPVHQ